MRTHYTDEQKAEALAAVAANRGNVAKTARQLGLPRGTLHNWAIRRGVPQKVRQLAHEKRAELADRMEALALGLVNGLLANPERRMGKINEVMIAFGIAVDKLILLRREATVINAQYEDRRSIYAGVTPRPLTEEDLE